MIRIFFIATVNYDPSNTPVLVDGSFDIERFDTVPELSIVGFYDVYWY